MSPLLCLWPWQLSADVPPDPGYLHAQRHGKRDSPAMVVTWCRGYLFVIDVPLQLWCRERLARCAVETYLFSDLVLLLFPCNVWAVLRKICQTQNKPVGCTFRCRAWCEIWRNLRPERVHVVEWQYVMYIQMQGLVRNMTKFEAWEGSCCWMTICQLYGMRCSVVG